MAAYAIGRLQMRDPSWVAEYGPKTAELVKKHGEETKVAVRKARHDAKDMLSTLGSTVDSSYKNPNAPPPKKKKG